MGRIDTLTKQYISDSAVFADAFNFFIYGGSQVIQPEELHVAAADFALDEISNELLWH